MSQQLQPQQQPQQWLPTLITALARMRAAPSMVALVNPRRADLPSRVTPRRANPRRAKPLPIARRWHQRLAPDSLSLPLRLTTCGLRAASREPPHTLPTGATLPRRRTRRSHSRGSDGISRRFATRTASSSFRRARLPPSCGPGLTGASTAPAKPQHCRELHPVAQPHPTPCVSRASRTTPTRRRTWSARCTTSASRSPSTPSPNHPRPHAHPTLTLNLPSPSP